MFCALEQIELTVSTCPAKKCMYKTATGDCGFSQLTEDNITPAAIAIIKGQKPYKVKSAIKSSVSKIKIGLAIDRYSDFVRSSFPARRPVPVAEEAEVVNEIDSHVRKVLRRVFGLADNQQKEFWSQERYEAWALRTGTAFQLTDIRESLADIKL